MRDARILRFFALLFSFTLIAAACGGGSESGDGGGGDGGDGSETTEDAGGPATTAVATETTADAAATGPVAGGTLRYGVEADSANPWAPYRVSCAISCYVVLRTISDSLFRPVTAGGVEGVLVESWEANEDYTEHTWTIRDGISFHDGTPLDAEAVAFNINTCRFSSLTGPALSGITDVTGEGQVLTITTGTPWVPLKENFSGGQCSYMFSPDWLASLEDVPFRTEGAPYFSEEVAATPADGDPTVPVGLGAFTYESFNPGNGNSFTAVKNADYWRGPNGITGEELPYLDSIEVTIAVDIASRSAAVQSGQFDIIHTSNADEIASFEGDDSVNLIKANDFGETSYIMLNSAVGENPTLAAIRGADAPIAMDPEGVNADSPIVILACRRALAHAINYDRLVQERGAGIVEVANGPFPPGSIGYLEDTGYPTFDIDAANTEMDTCLAEAGTDSIQFSFNTTNDPFNVETNQLVNDMWTEAFGDKVQTTVTPIEQGQYIGLALTGAFQAQSWRSHGGIDPDQQFLWWFSGTASPIGELALNFGRFQDPAIDAALIAQRTNDDPAVRQAAAEDVNRAFGENVWNIWTSWNLWGIISNPAVQNILGSTTPEGEPIRGIVSGGHDVTQIWCLEGSCES